MTCKAEAKNTIASKKNFIGEVVTSTADCHSVADSADVFISHRTVYIYA